MSDFEERIKNLQERIAQIPKVIAPGGADIDPQPDASAGGLERLSERLGACHSALAELQESFHLLQSPPQSAFNNLRAHGEKLQGSVSGLLETLEDDFQDAQERVKDIGERFPEMIQTKWGELGDAVDDLREEIEEKSEELWREAVNEATDEWKEGMVKEAMEAALKELKDFAEERLTDTVKEEARKVLEAAMERLKQEVMDGVVTSQLQAQLTSAMSPILPQLMVVRAVASAIKHALDILRMGF
jgi:DNA repair exonuclease SbcCD ATPase subunit